MPTFFALIDIDFRCSSGTTLGQLTQVSLNANAFSLLLGMFTIDQKRLLTTQSLQTLILDVF